MVKRLVLLAQAAAAVGKLLCWASKALGMLVLVMVLLVAHTAVVASWLLHPAQHAMMLYRLLPATATADVAVPGLP